MVTLDPLQFQIVLAFMCMIIFLIIYFIKKKFKNFKELIYDAFVDGATLYSGIIPILFALGKVFKIKYFESIDNTVLYFSLIFAGFIIIGGCLDKIKDKEDKNAK